MNIKKEFEFELSETIKCQHLDKVTGASEMLESNMLTLKAPTYYTSDQRVKLRQGYMQAIKSLQGNINSKKETETEAKDNEGSDSEITGGMVIDVLYMSNIDIISYIKTFEDMLVNVCYIDNKVQLTKNLIKKISLDDLEKLLGEYVANFIPASSAQ